jgi:tetratricopeptide (TPR) repeat protein
MFAPGKRFLPSSVCGITLSVMICASAIAGPSTKPWDGAWEQARAAEAGNRWFDAEECYKRAIGQASTSHATPEIIRELQIKLATTYIREKKFAQTEPIYQELMISQFVTPTNKRSEATRESIVWFDDLADTYASSADNRESCLKHALAIKQKIFAGRDDDPVLKILNELFLFYNLHQRYTEAKAILKEKIAMLEKESEYQNKVSVFGGHGNNDLVITLTQLAGIELALKQYNEYERDCRRGYSLAVAAFGANNAITTSFARGVASCLVRQGKLNEAVAWSKKTMPDTGSATKNNSTVFPEDQVGKDLLQLAIDCYRQGNYKASTDMLKQLIKFANTRKGSVWLGVPVFYVFLGTNMLAQENSFQMNECFAKAIDAASTIKGHITEAGKRTFVESYAEPVRFSTIPPNMPKLHYIREIELKKLLAVIQIVGTDHNFESMVLNALSGDLYCEGKLSEGDDCLERAVKLADLPNTDESLKLQLPERYLTLAIHRSELKQTTRANESFAAAFQKEADKKGFHAATVLFWWAFELKANGQSKQAMMKSDMALKIARALAPEKRGTILADALLLLSSFDDHKSEARLLIEESSKEIELQRKIRSDLGPDFYHRLSKS